MICTMPDCEREVHARGLCFAHYRRMHSRTRTTTSTLCKGPECDRPAEIVGLQLCLSHYRQHQRTGQLSPLRSVQAEHDAQIVVRMPAELKAGVEAAAERDGVSAAEWIRSKLLKYL